MTSYPWRWSVHLRPLQGLLSCLGPNPATIHTSGFKMAASCLLYPFLLSCNRLSIYFCRSYVDALSDVLFIIVLPRRCWGRFWIRMITDCIMWRRLFVLVNVFCIECDVPEFCASSDFFFVQERSATFLTTFFFLRRLRVESLELLELALSVLHV